MLTKENYSDKLLLFTVYCAADAYTWHLSVTEREKRIAVPVTVSEGCEQPPICVYQVTRKCLVKIMLLVENLNANILFFKLTLINTFGVVF